MPREDTVVDELERSIRYCAYYYIKYYAARVYIEADPVTVIYIFSGISKSSV